MVFTVHTPLDFCTMAFGHLCPKAIVVPISRVPSFAYRKMYSLAEGRAESPMEYILAKKWIIKLNAEPISRRKLQ